MSVVVMATPDKAFQLSNRGYRVLAELASSRMDRPDNRCLPSTGSKAPCNRDRRQARRIAKLLDAAAESTAPGGASVRLRA